MGFLAFVHLGQAERPLRCLEKQASLGVWFPANTAGHRVSDRWPLSRPAARCVDGPPMLGFQRRVLPKAHCISLGCVARVLRGTWVCSKSCALGESVCTLASERYLPWSFMQDFAHRGVVRIYGLAGAQSEI
ncbi:unnamed protein product [Effrenium voratum]|nr:unnamed protein product [Effrenium voratum]